MDKYEFKVRTTKYLSFIVNVEKGLSIDPVKVKAIQNWKVLKSSKVVLSFLGFVNFYRRFIKDYSQLTAPLHNLTKKDTPFHWDDKADETFKALKLAFISAPILAQFDPDRETVLETDSSGYCTGGIMS